MQRWVLAATLLMTAGCSAEPATTQPPIPTAPAGWTTTASMTADLRITLPPWLVPFETSGPIFANEVVGPGAQGMQLLAEGPRNAEPQPGPGADLRSWLTLKIGGSAQGTATFRDVRLPVGTALILERVDRPLGPTPWRILTAAIRTSAGVTFLMVDGPPERWVGREADVALVLQLLETSDGHAP